MLGVGLRKLCSLDSFGKAFREKKIVRNRPRRVQNRPAGGGQTALLEGLRAALLCQLRPTWPPRPLGSCVWAALGALVTLLEPSWGPPGACRAAPGRLLGAILGPPRADLDDLGVVCGQREI